MFESLGIKYSNLPGAEVSLVEWQKHLSVHTIEITKEEIIISGICKHPIIESGIREFCQIIEHEVQDTVAVLRRNGDEITQKYNFILPSVVRANLRSDGYIFMNLALKLDEASVMSLLMGTNLYESSLAAVRELIQNGIDSCQVRKALISEASYKPLVSVNIEKNIADGSLWLSVKDNGIGMDEYVLKNHFFRVGSSYYNSPEYKILYKNSTNSMPVITSKFGIGFLSTFMLGNEIEISTKKIYPGGESKGMKIFIERMGALSFVQEDDALEIGTTVKVKIKLDSILEEPNIVEKFIAANIIRPVVPIEYTYDRYTKIFDATNFYNLNINPKSEFFKNNIIPYELNLNNLNGISGKIIFLFFEDDNKKLCYRNGDSIIEITSASITKNKITVNPKLLMPDFEGNRVTVGGFKMSFPKMSKIFKSSRYKKIAFMYDLDFLPKKDVEFNVSRSKILDLNFSVRNKLRDSIIKTLESNNQIDRFEEQTLRMIQGSLANHPFDASKEEIKKRLSRNDSQNVDVSAELLQKVRMLLPPDFWPKGIHATIAKELNISNGQAYVAIARLIATSAIKNPVYNDSDDTNLINN